MSDLNLRVITTSNPGELEEKIYNSTTGDLKIKRFSARHNAVRNHYEVVVSIENCRTPHRLISHLSQEHTIRELSPIREGSAVPHI